MDSRNSKNSKYVFQVKKDIPLKDQFENGLAHQKRFYFIINKMPEMDTDQLVEIIWDDFTLGKKHKQIDDISKSEGTLIITFSDRLCYRFGVHSYLDGEIELELVKKSDFDLLARKKIAEKWKAKVMQPDVRKSEGPKPK